MGKAQRQYGNKLADRFLAVIDENEAVVRMLEAAMGIARPAGETAEEILARPETADAVASARRMFKAVMAYQREQIAKGGRKYVN